MKKDLFPEAEIKIWLTANRIKSMEGHYRPYYEVKRYGIVTTGNSNPMQTVFGSSNLEKARKAFSKEIDKQLSAGYVVENYDETEEEKLPEKKDSYPRVVTFKHS